MTRRIPLVTLALIALNVLVYLFGPSVSGQTLPAGAPTECAQAVFAQRYGAVPVELTRNQPIHIAPAAVVDGRVVSCPKPGFHKRPFVSALTSTFVHANAVHLIGNMVVLLALGATVERRMGRGVFAAFYLVCGYTAAYGFAFAMPGETGPLIGASGAIAGVLGAYLWLRPGDWLTPLFAVPFLVPLPLPAWLVGSPGANVAYLAHVVGFVVGLSLAMAWTGRGSTPRTPSPSRAGSPVPT